MSALSSPIHELADRYGVVVVGSGYGGSITAARLAAKSASVCLLERGKDWTVRRFPDHLLAIEAELRTESNPLGLYDYRFGHDVDVFAGSGLGGTSLINAAVAFRPGPEVFRSARWPREIRDAPGCGGLEPYFARVETELGVSPLEPGLDTLKVAAHARSAKHVARLFSRVDVAINLRERDTGVPGVLQPACTLCGDCVTGCNVGAKNTLATNYLPLAKKAGASIFTQVEVDYVLPAEGGGYFVYMRHHPGDRLETEPRVVHAEVVVLAAGSLGTTGILLRSAERGLAVTRGVGRSFSSNGDLLGFAYNTDVRTDAAGFGAFPPSPPSYKAGPTISAYVDYRSGTTGALDFLIEDGVIPTALTGLFRYGAPGAAVLEGDDTDTGVRDRAQELARIVLDQIGQDGRGALHHSMVYLAMGHDGADGRIVLDHDEKPCILWGAAGERLVFERESRAMRDLVTGLGGTYLASPRWAPALGKNPLTVHPLGGCPMGDDADRGAVNHAGQVFHRDGSLHDGLYVADGAAVPTSLGVNPFLTIAALAERVAERIHDERARKGKGAIAARKTPIPVAAAPEPPPGLDLTERMRGYVTAAVTSAKEPHEFVTAAEIARAEGAFCDFRLAILIDDVARFIASPEHAARVEGYVDTKAFGRKLLVEEGSFQLFVDADGGATKRMFYDLQFRSAEGAPHLLSGFKVIRDDPGLDMVADTTTLFTSIHAGFSRHDPVCAQGVLHIQGVDYLGLVSSLRVHHAKGPLAEASWLTRFGRFFFGALWDTYVRDKLVNTPTPA